MATVNQTQPVTLEPPSPQVSQSSDSCGPSPRPPSVFLPWPPAWNARLPRVHAGKTRSLSACRTRWQLWPGRALGYWPSQPVFRERIQGNANGTGPVTAVHSTLASSHFRQRKSECRADSFLTFDGHLPAVSLRKRFHNGQSQAGSTCALRIGFSLVEDFLQ
jgi:hypothetical protein